MSTGYYIPVIGYVFGNYKMPSSQAIKGSVLSCSSIILSVLYCSDIISNLCKFDDDNNNVINSFFYFESFQNSSHP
jgi:hypothetical protein